MFGTTEPHARPALRGGRFAVATVSIVPAVLLAVAAAPGHSSATSAGQGTAVHGSCSPTSAPLLRFKIRVHASGSECSAGRVYFKLKVASAPFTVILEWQEASTGGDGAADFECQTGSICDYALYPPGTTVYTIDSVAPRCGNLNGHYTPWVVKCKLRRAGKWLLAVGANGYVRVRPKR